jgi:hypothetical protein
VAFCHVTTQIKGEKHADLLQQKGGAGFPHIVFMDAEGKVLAEHNGPRNGAGFAKTGETAKAFVALREKAAKGDPAAKADLLVQQLKMGHVKAADAEKEAASMKLSDAQKAAFEAALADARVMDMVRGLRSQEDAKKAGQEFLSMHKAGKKAPTGDEAIQPYWILLMGAAEEAKDVPAFEAALKALRAKFGDAPQAAGFFKKQEAKLAELKGAEKK